MSFCDAEAVEDCCRTIGSWQDQPLQGGLRESAATSASRGRKPLRRQFVSALGNGEGEHG